MALEEVFVDGDVLMGDKPPAGLVRLDRIDEHGGVAVTKSVEERRDIECDHS